MASNRRLLKPSKKTRTKSAENLSAIVEVSSTINDFDQFNRFDHAIVDEVSATVSTFHPSAQGQTHSVLAKRKGYQNPATLAQELRLLQAQGSMSFGDSEQDALSIAQVAKSYGAEILVTSSGGPLANELKKIEAIHAYADLNRAGPIVNMVNKKRVKDICSGFRPNVIAARSRAPAHAAKAAAHLYKLPFVTYFHAIYDVKSDKQHRFNGVLASGDRVIVPSQYVYDHVQKFYGVPSERLSLIPRGVDLYRFSPTAVNPQAVMDLRNKLGLVAGRPVFVMSGRLSFWKGHHLFIEAIKGMSETNPYGLIFTYGDQEKDYAQDLEKLLKRWKMGDRIKIIHEPQDMPTVYGLADAVVSTSIEPEGFIRSIAEAMCLGKACIAANHGSAPEQILHHETGWLFPPGDVGALVTCLKEAISLDEEPRANLAAWSMEAARTKHDLAKVCDEEIDIFLQLLNG
ncbi:MAG: glycosyltransferase [Alphaproteobacteria bacterium]